jgi:hypothetical protein
MTQIKMRITGPDRYCPDCGRFLVRVKEDGRFDLAAKSSVEIVWDGRNPAELFSMTEHVAYSSVLDAHCLRLRCRLRRWWYQR